MVMVLFFVLLSVSGGCGWIVLSVFDLVVLTIYIYANPDVVLVRASVCVQRDSFRISFPSIW